MQNLFHTHPYSTTVGILIERATDSGKPCIDWALILEICDALYETDDGPKDAIRAIRKRLTSAAGKDHLSVWYTLILIEACVKNCGKRFQAQVANRDFLRDLIKLLLPKYDAPIQIQTKVLLMLKCWVDSCWEVPGRRDLEKVYTALRRKGVQFPITTADDSAKAPPPSIINVKRTQNNNSRSLRLSSAFRRFTGSAFSSSRSNDGGRSGSGDSAGLFGSGDVRYQIINSASPATDSPQMRQYQHRQHQHHHQHYQHNSSQRVAPVAAVVTARAQSDGRFASRTAGEGQGSPRENHSSHPVHLVASAGALTQNTSWQAPLAATGVNSVTRQPSSQRAVPLTTSLPSDINRFPSPDRTYIDQEGTVRRLSSLQREKLSQDLMVVQTNIHILNDMLTELQPDSVNPDDLELLQELNETCHMMQQRVAEFLAQVADDAVTLSLLQLNDELNGVFQRYERFERYRLRAMRAMIANSPHRAGTAQTSMPALTCTTSRPTHSNQQAQHQPAQQALPSQPTPLAITGPDPKSSEEEEDYDDDDDDELLDAIAEQPRTFPPSSAEDLIDISSWAHHRSTGQENTTPVTSTGTVITSASANSRPGTVSENLLALETLRLDGGFVNNLQTLPDDCTANQLQSIFGPSCQHPITAQTQDTPSGNGGFLIDPLIPVPAAVLTRTETKELQSAATGNERRLDESLLLFET
ncbi:hypothetical protein AAHC03_020641 [Spirometra sp. Aus1]